VTQNLSVSAFYFKFKRLHLYIKLGILLITSYLPCTILTWYMFSLNRRTLKTTSSPKCVNPIKLL